MTYRPELTMKTFLLLPLLAVVSCAPITKKAPDAEIGLEDFHRFPNGTSFHVKSAVRFNGVVTITALVSTVDEVKSYSFDKDSLRVVIDGYSYTPFEVLGEEKVNPERAHRILISLSAKDYPDLKWRTLDRRTLDFEIDFLN